MNPLTNSNDLAALRRAVTKSLFKGGPSVYARELHRLHVFRVIGVKYNGATLPPTISGKSLEIGKWVPIAEWETRP